MINPQRECLPGSVTPSWVIVIPKPSLVPVVPHNSLWAAPLSAQSNTLWPMADWSIGLDIPSPPVWRQDTFLQPITFHQKRSRMKTKHWHVWTISDRPQELWVEHVAVCIHVCYQTMKAMWRMSFTRKRCILLSLKLSEWRRAETTESSGYFTIRKCHTEDFGEFSFSHIVYCSRLYDLWRQSLLHSLHFQWDNQACLSKCSSFHYLLY